MAWTQPRLWEDDDLVTGAMMNTEVKTHLEELFVGEAAGDMEYYDSATTKIKIPKGTDGQILKMVGGVPTWVNSIEMRGAVGVCIYNSVFQTIANNTSTLIDPMDSEKFDYGGFHTGASSDLIIPAGKDGLYLCGGHACWTNQSTVNKLRQIGFIFNDENLWTSGTNDASSAIWQSITTLKYLVAGNRIGLVAFQLSGGNLDLYNARLWCVRVD